MNLLRKIKCWLRLCKEHSYDEWYTTYGSNLTRKEVKDMCTPEEYVAEIKRTMKIAANTCKHCGRGL